MNSRQRLVLALGAVLIALQLLYPPWRVVYHSEDGLNIQNLGRAWIWNKPENSHSVSGGVRIHSSGVTPGIAIVAIATFVAFHLTRTRIRKDDAISE